MCSYVNSCCSSVGAFGSSAVQAAGNALSCVIAAIKSLASTIFAGVSSGFSAFMGLSMPVQAGVVAGAALAVGAAAWACGCFGKKAEAGAQQQDVQKNDDVQDVQDEAKVS